MVEHVFGGGWTEDKLRRLRDYLVAYRNIFANNERASFLKTWYVDAFAGTGSRSLPTPTSDQLDYGEGFVVEGDSPKFMDGSAKIAMGLPSPFDHYLFIEQRKKRAQTLRVSVQEEFPALENRVEVRIDDANNALCEWCGQRDWTKERAVVFLDPYGMQVKWKTVGTLAKTKGVDLWYLFPLATRVLTHDGNMDESWANKLDSLFGTPNWRLRFYSQHVQPGLFGEVESVKRNATALNIQSFIEERLRSCFAEVADSRIISNARSPIFSLCFAASNEKGSKTAIKIAQHILRN
ncbi:MAG: three-Cys-motif partner protein TcmP [Edaphobacter sp.]